MAEAMTVSPGSSPRSPKPLLDVRMLLPRSYRAETSMHISLALTGEYEVQKATPVATDRGQGNDLYTCTLSHPELPQHSADGNFLNWL